MGYGMSMRKVLGLLLLGRDELQIKHDLVYGKSLMKTGSRKAVCIRAPESFVFTWRGAYAWTQTGLSVNPLSSIGAEPTLPLSPPSASQS